MNDSEVNKIIAEFMGMEIQEHDHCGFMLCRKIGIFEDKMLPKYTRSIDAINPVWDKMHYTPDFKRRTGKKGWVCSGKQSFLEDIKGMGNTMQLAAAHATAKAIQELK